MTTWNRVPQRIGILGGTFDPIHFGHLLMAENAMEQLGLDLVLFAPAGDPPHKPGNGIVDGETRLSLVELAISDRPGFEASHIDLDADGPSYTWNLLERCHRRWPLAALHFVLGGDSLVDFPTWARPERILELARLAVVPRPGVDSANHRVTGIAGLAERVDVIDAPLSPLSSTDIRERVAAGRSIRYLVPEPVRAAIHELGLYR